MNKKISIILAVLVVVAGVYWFSTIKPGSGTPNQEQITSTVEDVEVTVAITGPLGVATGVNGKYLVDKNNLTLYVNVKDEGQTGDIKPSCNAECEKTWIPYLFNESESAITQSSDPLLSKLNLFTRADGKKQYALGTKPLYRYLSDLKPGDINGPLTGDWMVAQP